MTATISAFAVSQIPTEPHRTKVTTGLSDKYKRKGMWRVYVNHYQLLGKSACTKTKRLEKTPKILENLKIRWRPLFFLDFLVKTDNRPEWQVQRKSMRACLCQSLSIVWKVCFLEVFLTYYVTYLYQLPRFEKWKRLGSSIVNSKPDKSDNRPEWQVQTERHARVFMSIIINCLESLLSMGFQSDGYVFESGLNSVTLKVQPSKA